MVDLPPVKSPGKQGRHSANDRGVNLSNQLMTREAIPLITWDANVRGRHSTNDRVGHSSMSREATLPMTVEATMQRTDPQLSIMIIYNSS